MNEAVVRLLYILMRDEVPCGVVAKILKEYVDHFDFPEVIFTNKHLEAYAREIERKLQPYNKPEDLL